MVPLGPPFSGMRNCIYHILFLFSVPRSVTGIQFSSVQFSSVAQLYQTLCDPMNRSMPGLPVHHQLLELT